MPVGKRSVRIDLPPGAIATSDPARDVKVRSDTRALIDFGIVQTGSISGSLFGDRDGNGVRSGNEWGYGGWSVFLDRNDNGRRDRGEPKTITDPAGRYLFTDLLPGDYRVRVSLFDGYTFSTKRSQSIEIAGDDAYTAVFGVTSIR
ncbi:MAG: SdrD B-like domain-containing protein [Tepidisphaeraceae bacterium]